MKVDLNPTELNELRALRLWHWQRYLATKSFVKTNPATKEGMAALHLAAVKTLNALFPAHDTGDLHSNYLEENKDE